MHARPITRLRVHALIGMAGLAWSAAGANAQNALGDGRALDANTGAGGRVNYQRPSFSQELQFRNAVVTGNAPGGLSFRGDIGYRAAGEFTGDLGSDDLFSFRRDSLYSGLAGMGIRGTDALQYQFSLTTGARPPQNLTGDLNYSRGGRNQTTSTSYGDSATTIGRDPLDMDARGLSLYKASAQESDLSDAISGSLRSSSSYNTTTSLSPVILTTFEQGLDRRSFGLTSSMLTGVSSVPMRSQEDSKADTRANPTGVPRDPTAPRGKTAYEEVVERMRLRAEQQAARNPQTTSQTMPGNTAPADASMDSIAKRLEALRNGLMGNDQPAANTPPGSDQTGTQPMNQPGTRPSGGPGGENPTRTTAPMGTAPGSSDPTQADPRMSNPSGQQDARANPAGEALRAEYDPARYSVDAKTLELIRASEAPLTGFIDPDAEGRDFYSEHMRAGERLITAERYFDAEERFARALSLNPGDPTAQVGRAHAQLGAGLTLSASVNLRSLFVLNPEMIGVRYAGRLLPSPDRIDVLIENLRERSGLVRVPGRPLEEVSSRISSALLLSYLGYQNERPDVVQEGFGIVREIGSPEDIRLVTILDQVWAPDPAENVP